MRRLVTTQVLCWDQLMVTGDGIEVMHCCSESSRSGSPSHGSLARPTESTTGPNVIGTCFGGPEIITFPEWGPIWKPGFSPMVKTPRCHQGIRSCGKDGHSKRWDLYGKASQESDGKAFREVLVWWLAWHTTCGPECTCSEIRSQRKTPFLRGSNSTTDIVWREFSIILFKWGWRRTLITTTCLYSWLVVHAGWQKEFFPGLFLAYSSHTSSSFFNGRANPGISSTTNSCLLTNSFNTSHQFFYEINACPKKRENM